MHRLLRAKHTIFWTALKTWVPQYLACSLCVCILWQNISLRGHCEQTGSDSNPGNFHALIDIRLDAGDSILADHFKTCARNAQYISPQVQNDVISCVGEWIRKRIIEDVITARFFSVSADEAVDCSNKEQLPLV